MLIKTPKVKLLNVTHSPLISLIESYRVCRNSFDKSDTTLTEQGFVLGPNDEKLIKRCVLQKHFAPMEFVNFKFEITDISKVADRQLCRHRISSFSAMSGRHCVVKGHMVPPTIASNPRAFERYITLIGHIQNEMEEIAKHGVPLEDLRYLEPMASTCTFHYQANLRSLRNFLAERLCTTAQWEIMEIAKQIKEIVKTVHPIFLYNFEKCRDCETKCHNNEVKV